MDKVNLLQKFSLFDEHWKPKIVGDVNDHLVKVVKFRGDFVWHSHEKEDELFLVVRGRMTHWPEFERRFPLYVYPDSVASRFPAQTTEPDREPVLS